MGQYTYPLSVALKDPNDWYPFLRQAMSKGNGIESVLVPNDFSLKALDQLVQASEEVGLSLKPLSLNVASVIGTHLWFGEGEYLLIVIGCYQDKVHACIAEASDYKERNENGELYTERFIEVVAHSLDLNKHELVLQLESLFKAHGVSAKDIKCSFIHGEVDFLHQQLDGYFPQMPCDQTHMEGYEPANAGLDCMSAIIHGEKKDYVLIDISPYSLVLYAQYGESGSEKLLVIPESLDISLALPSVFQLFFCIRNQKLWVVQSLHGLTPDSSPPYAFPYDSQPVCTLPYDCGNPPTKLVLMQKTAWGELIPYKEFEIDKLQCDEVINLGFDYNTNGQIEITQGLIKRMR